MFKNVRRGATGLGALVTVAAVIAMYFAAVGVMWVSWRDGGASPAGDCALVCAKVAAAASHG